MFDLKGIKDAADVIVRAKASQEVVLFADYCSETSFSFKSASDYAKRKGVKAIRWDKDKEGELKLSTEVFELKWLPILLGGSFKAGGFQITKREVLTVDKTTHKTKALAEDIKDGTLQVFVLNAKDKVSHDKKLTAGETAETGKYKYDTVGKTIEVSTDLDEKDLVVYYIPKTLPQGQIFKVNADDFPINYEIQGSTATRNIDGKDEPFMFLATNCKPKAEMTLNLSVDNVVKLDMTFDLLADANKDMVIYGMLDEELGA